MEQNIDPNRMPAKLFSRYRPKIWLEHFKPIVCKNLIHVDSHLKFQSDMHSGAVVELETLIYSAEGCLEFETKPRPMQLYK